ncbi:EAL domain-containing protein [Vibrio sp. 10N.261.51.F12]|uniref:EAL domain-containing protein n=1 Tax=Vibrio sp. 10N.261.51.F12 TaxID=3229679 RepID=UPI00354D8D7D
MKLRLRLQGQYTLATFLLATTLISASIAVHLWLSSTQSDYLRAELSAQHTQASIKTVVRRATQVSGYLASVLVNPLNEHNVAITTQLLQPIKDYPEVINVSLLDQNYEFIVQNDEVSLPSSSLPALVKVFSDAKTVQQITDQQVTVIQPIIINDKVAAALYLIMSTDNVQDHVDAADKIVAAVNSQIEQKLYLSLFIMSVALLLFSAVIATFISRRLSRPITNLTLRTNAIGRGDFDLNDHDDTSKRTDEIGELSSAIRAMAAKLEQRTQKITHLAYHDALTELPNKTQFIQHLQSTIKSYPATSFSVLFLDLDEFKVVNDNYGHDSGDFLLIRLAEKLTLCARDITNNHPLTMISRIGGDEFLMLIPHLKSIQDVDSVVKQIFVAVRSPILMENEELVVGGSIGVARYPYNGKSADELIKHADIAMYRAKSDGKNTHKLFTPKMFKSVVHRANMERELRRSLSDLKQFELWFQPLVCLKTGRTIGAEALVRWRHPTIGLISPADFISIAEETAMILPLGQWLIENLCFQIQQWMPYFDSDFHASINISSKQLYRQNLVEMFAFYMEKYQVPARTIRMEITESLLLQDEDEAERTLKAIRESGIEVWLDDFGTGYSSLSYLRRFTVDGIKIDQSFVRDITTDVKDQQLVQAMIAMANNLDLLVVAEGIETREQARKLAQFGCQIGQGYYYDRPIPVEQFVNRLINENESNVIEL